MPKTRCLAGLTVVVLATCAAPKAPTPEPGPSRGAVLFAHHCAVCHGQDGDADTVVASLLLPRPTAFRQGLFKLVSTQNGMPTEEDLVSTLRRGMPGSTMMSWGWLPDSDLQALAHEVRLLAVRGRTESIHQTAAIAQRPLTLEQAAAAAELQLLPGPTVDTGLPNVATSDTLAEGERLYRQHCASCHGTDGRGLPAVQDWPTDGTWLWPRDFTSGYLRGSASHRDLAFRIRAGMPGAHMPPTQLSTAETEALVGYVKGLIPETKGDHHAQWRRTIRVPRVDVLPASSDDAAFERGEAIRLPLAPLWWRPEACDETWLHAMHDGDELVLRLEWADATRDDRGKPAASMGDGAAVQFTRSNDPPLFAMGSATEPVSVWRWRAFDGKDTAGMLDLVTQRLHQGLDVPIGSLQTTPRTESLVLHGIASVADATGSGQPLAITTRWHEGRWTATFRRTLRARHATEIDLSEQGPLLIALAIWDGSLDAHAGSKSITTWHALELQR